MATARFLVSMRTHGHTTKSSDNYLYETLKISCEEKANEIAYILSLSPKFSKVTITKITEEAVRTKIQEYRKGESNV